MTAFALPGNVTQLVSMPQYLPAYHVTMETSADGNQPVDCWIVPTPNMGASVEEFELILGDVITALETSSNVEPGSATVNKYTDVTPVNLI